MIYYDKKGHLVADSLAELHEFAQKIGLSRNYYEGVKKGHPHYDLTNKTIISKAISNGAKLLRNREVLAISKKMLINT